MPLVIPVAVAMGETPGGAVVLVPTIGAVLAGAVFGDHCSPISDTTIVSAVSSRHPTIVNAALADGSVRQIANGIDLATWMGLGTKNLGETLADF